MTIREALETVDRLKPNQYGSADKLRWLSELDGAVYREILTQHEMDVPAFAGYLEMKIDDANGEMTKYNNSAAKYNMYYQAYQNAYNRAHLPKSEAAYIKL